MYPGDRLTLRPNHMTMKKYIGYALWLLAFLIPFRGSFVETEDASNMMGLFGLIGVVALIFTGYVLVDSAKPAADAHH